MNFESENEFDLKVTVIEQMHIVLNMYVMAFIQMKMGICLHYQNGFCKLYYYHKYHYEFIVVFIVVEVAVGAVVVI